MKDENQIEDEEAVAAEDAPEGVDAPDPAPTDDERRDLEELARKAGWRPKAEFRGDPNTWRDADEYLNSPVAQRNLLRDTVRDLEKRERERTEQIARIERMSQVAVQRAREQERQAYEAKLAQIEEAKRAAVETADVQRFDQLTAMQAKMAPPEPVAPPAPSAPAEIAEYAAKEEGKWLRDERAVAYARALIDQNQNVQYLPPLKQVQWAEAQVKQYWPEYFPAAHPAVRTSKVDGGGVAGLMKRGKGADDLPADAKRIGEGFVKEGIFRSLDEYARDYFAQG